LKQPRVFVALRAVAAFVALVALMADETLKALEDG